MRRLSSLNDSAVEPEVDRLELKLDFCDPILHRKHLRSLAELVADNGVILRCASLLAGLLTAPTVQQHCRMDVEAGREAPLSVSRASAHDPPPAGHYFSPGPEHQPL